MLGTFVPKDAQVEALRRSLDHYERFRNHLGFDGFAYFMEQGLGKTGTSYADFLRFVEMGKVQRMVVFCPNSFKGGWVEEAEKWGMNVQPYIYTPENAKYISSAIRKGFDKPPVLIVNYEASRTEAARDLIGQFGAERRVFGVADESIQLKDFDSQQTKSVLDLGKSMAITRILSGKPTTQGPHDLWAPLRFAKQLNGQMFHPFKTAFCRMGGFKNKQVVGVQNEDILAMRIDPHIFRATKDEWTDLPPKIYTMRDYVMTPEMKSMYKQMEDEFILWFGDGENVSVDQAITKYIKLAQIQCGFIKDEDGKVHMLVSPDKNPRIKLLREIIEDEIVGKVTVVYRHRVVFDILMEAFSKYNPSFIRGQMSSTEIEDQKRIFNNDPRSRIMFLQTKAAKYGHTLLGLPNREDHCSSQIFFENTYSLDDRSQIEDRSHRYGQLGEVMSYFDLIGTSLDRSAVKALQRKEDIFQAIFQLIGRRPLGST
jgi:SNF2 family DNA or RNA helicase